MSFSISHVVDSPPDTPQRPAAVLDVVILAPVAEALTPRKEVAELRRRPVPAAGIRTGFIEPTDDRAIREQHVHLSLRRHEPVLMAVPVKLGRIVHGVFPIESLCFSPPESALNIARRCVHSLAGIRGNTGIDRAVRHDRPDLYFYCTIASHELLLLRCS